MTMRKNGGSSASSSDSCQQYVGNRKIYENEPIHNLGSSSMALMPGVFAVCVLGAITRADVRLRLERPSQPRFSEFDKEEEFTFEN
jgi:hypothetical protein